MRNTFFGLLLILAGLALLLDNFGIIPGLPGYLFYWANIFLVLSILIGLSGNYRGALTLLCFWGFFTAKHYWDVEWSDIWPVLILVAGVSILLKKKSEMVLGHKDQFDEVNIFSGSKRVYTSQQFKGGKITNVFGGGNLDLRQCHSDGAVIEIITIFGGCDIIVPENWNVSMNATAIFGGFEDKRPKGTERSGPVLVIRGLTLFGGGQVRSFV